MKSWIRRRLAGLRADLVEVRDRQPLHRAVLVVLLFLDLFVLLSVFDGLEKHARQLDTPWDRVPRTCREIVLQGQWSRPARLDVLGEELLARRSMDRDRRARNVHPTCAALMAAIDAVAAAKTIEPLFEARRREAFEARGIEGALAGPKGAYDTALLEEAAGRGEGAPSTGALRDAVRARTAALDAARARLAALDAQLDAAPPVAALWARIEGIVPADAERLRSDLRSIERWFPAQRLAMELLFLLPLFALLWLWNAKASKRGRGVQTLVSAHLLAVAFVPILFRVVDAVYEIIPRRLLARLIALLESAYLVAIWHYLVIALAVLGVLVVVYVLQRKLFSPERLLERRVGRGLCLDCGRRLPPGARACVHCGFVQLRACPACSAETLLQVKHCRSCGAAIS